MVEKAVIRILEGPQQGEEIQVMFNPTEYSVSTNVEMSGEGRGIQFQRVGMETFSISLFYDTYESQTDVRDETDQIVSLTMPAVELRETSRPPYCNFIWGGFSYSGIISNVDQRFTMFLESGIPVRAELSVTFKRVESIEEDLRNRGREACRKVWTVKTGDRLDLIAFNALKNPAQWRKIAESNNINNPLAFPTDDDIGRMLVIPD